ncbi:MAG: hypothetical protein O3B01_01410 [Planctomycetota bacterium]|nr:hypothetical protein [Planctomycetota bacterium]
MRAIIFFLGVFSIASPIFSEHRSISFGNEHVRRTFLLRDGVWLTTEFVRLDGSEWMTVDGEEFQARLMDGRIIRLTDFKADEPKIETQGERQTLTIRYRPVKAIEGGPTAIDIIYWADKQPWFWKKVILHMKEGDVVDRLEVERFRCFEPKCERGGRGEPIFIEKTWFTGLEYPGGQSTHGDDFPYLPPIGNYSYISLGPDEKRAPEGHLVTFAHYPGKAKSDPKSGEWLIESKTFVAGVPRQGDTVELGFLDYLETVRLKRKSILHYNSWYDSRGSLLHPDNLMKTFEGFKKNLLDPYDLKLGAFVPDDGWQIRNSISEPRTDFYPNGFGPFARKLEAGGSRLGLWWAINGYNSNIAWGVQNGWAQAKTNAHFSRFSPHYCLAHPKYLTEVKKRTQEFIKTANISYYKHDFNNLSCMAEGHGHLPTDRHGHEALMDAEFDFLAFQRELQPGIFLNCTNWIWFSPWWLQHAHSLWMLAGDTGQSKDWPQLSPREWAMSYRDQHLFRIFQNPVNRPLVSISDLMTHGIIQGRYHQIGDEKETLREWSDYVMLYYGRGVQLKELYITPDLLDQPRWDILGRATRWAEDNSDLLANSTLFGGDPRQGEVTGYVSWRKDQTGKHKALVILRNPDVQSKQAKVPFDRSVRFRGKYGVAHKSRVIYPYVQDISRALISGQPMLVEVPPCSVVVYEIEEGAGAEKQPPGPEPVQTQDKDGGVVISIPDEPMGRCDLYLVQRGSRFSNDVPVSLNGEDAIARTASGPNWRLQSIDLLPYRGKQVNVELKGSVAQTGLFPREAAKSVDVWLIADRSVKPSAQPGSQGMPPLNWNTHRRISQQLFLTPQESGQTTLKITAEQLKTIKEVKIRLLVFGANSEKQYSEKRITLNGVFIARMPPNSGTLDAWQEKFIPIPPEHLADIKETNSIELTNHTADMFKVTGFALAIMLEDGTWSRTNIINTTYTSLPGWAHGEGSVMSENKTGTLELKFSMGN